MDTHPGPSVIINALRTLTTAAKQTDTPPPVKEQSTFEQLLENNIHTFETELQTTLLSFSEWWIKDTDIVVFPDCPARWKFVTYCLKSLHLLQKSLNESIEEYKKKEHDSVKPSAAPVMSPDTLSFNDIKVIKTALQFIVSLGICPYLQKGVGIPLELRSGFSEMVKLSGEGKEESVEETSKKLLICLKVLVSCVFNPSLGTTVLTQHFTDILAALLQLIHTTKSKNWANTDPSVERGEKGAEIDIKEKLQHLKLTPALAVENKPQKIDSGGGDDVIETGEINRDKHVIETGEINRDKPSETRDKTGNETKGATITTSEESADGRDCDRNKHVKHYIGQSWQISDTEYCEKVLEDLLQKVYPPLLVKTLLMLQGGPRKKPGSTAPMLPPAPVWLRKVCGEQLTAIVMRPKGVLSVLRGMLDVPGASRGMTGAADWRKCDAVAMVIAKCPKQSQSQEMYFKQVGPQILDLLHIQDKQFGREFLRVACSTISNMVVQNIHLSRKYVIFPLLQPLLACIEGAETASSSGGVVVEETRLTRCVEDCHKVFVCGITDNPGLITNIQPVILVLYHLLVFTRSGVAALRTAVQEILVAYLKENDLPVSLTCLQLMTFHSSQSELANEIPRMQQGLTFANGPTGGVMVVESQEGETETKDEVNVECIVQLLKDLSQCDLCGEFVVYMLYELTKVIQTETQGDCKACRSQPSTKFTDSQALFDMEQQNQSAVEHFYRKLKLLNVLASVCEELGPTCIRSAKQTLEFIKATLQRGVQVCSATEDAVFEVFESETLTMAMGLLTAVLTGAFQLTERDRQQMEELLPLLLEISENHSDISVQEMATDIRIAIATHGAVWSEVTKNRGQDFSKMTEKLKKEKKEIEKQKQEKTKPGKTAKSKIEVLQESEKLPDKNTKHLSPDVSIESNSPRNDRNTQVISDHRTSDTKHTKDLLTKPSVQTTEIGGSDKIDSEEPKQIDKDNNDILSKRAERTDADLIKDTETISELEMAFKELCDPLIPVRGHGLIRLTKLIRNRDPDVLDRQEAVLKIFEENLDHPDSYLYLSAVNGLSEMCDMVPGLVLPKICEQFSAAGSLGKKRSTELRMKLGEIMVKATRCLGETIPQYKDLLITTVLVGAKDEEPFVRATSLSNLGDICKLLRFSLGNIVHEVFNCCSSLLKSDSDVQVRKAAGQAIVLLLQGMGDDVFKILGSVLKDLYRLLKQVMLTEVDDRVKVHVHLALEELDLLMKRQLFTEQKLEKRIRVRDFD